MKYLLAFLPMMAMSQIHYNEITRTRIIVDSVIETGLDATINYHSEANGTIKPHQWEFTITETIPSDKFIADDYRGKRECIVCKRNELFHTETWSERINK